MKKSVLATLASLACFAVFAESVVIDPGAGKTEHNSQKHTGSVDLTIKSGFVTLNPENDYFGTTKIDGGTLELTAPAPAGAPSEIGSDGPVDLADGVLRYTGPAGAIFGHPITNSLPSTDNSTSVAALDIQSDLVLTNWFNTKFIPTVKYGKGSLILRGKATKSPSYWFQFTQGISGKGADTASKQFVVPTDGTAPRTGFDNFALLEGKIILDEGWAQIPGSGSRAYFGGWTAGEGEEEADVELVINNGSFTVANHHFGQLHGFKDYNTPRHAARAWLTVNGGTYIAATGQPSRWGSNSDAPTVTLKDGTKKTLEFNTDIRVTINKGGTWTHDKSFSGFSVCQRPGQTMRITVDGGTFHDYMTLFGYGAVTNDVTGTVAIDIKNGGLFEVGGFYLNSNTSTPYPSSMGKTKTNTPPVTISVTAGGVFSAQWVTNFTSSVLEFIVDGGILQNYDKQLYYDPASGTPAEILRPPEKVIVPPNATSLTLGKGGVTIKSAGNCWEKKPNIVVIGRPFVHSTELDEGVRDGGVTVECGASPNKVRLLGEQRYNGPTVVKSGILEIVGPGSKLPNSSETTVEGGELCLAGVGAPQNLRRYTIGEGEDGRGTGLRLGPGVSVVTSDFIIHGTPKIVIDFTDTDGVSLTTTQSRRQVLTFPLERLAEFEQCSFCAATGSNLVLADLDIQENSDATATLIVTMQPVGSPGLPKFEPDFVGTLTLKGGAKYELSVSNPDVLQYKAGKYLVARYKKDGDTSILDRFEYPGYAGKDVYFTETYIASGTHEGFTEIYLNIVDLSMQDATWTGADTADNLMSTLGNWQGPPSSIDLVKGSLHINVPQDANNEMVFEDGTRIGSFISSRDKTASPFWVRGATPESEMIIDGRFSVSDLSSGGSTCNGNNGQIVLQGHFRAMDGVDTTTPVDATKANASQFAFCCGCITSGQEPPPDLIGGYKVNGGPVSVPLVLAGAHIHHKMAVATSTTGQRGIHVMPNTDNSIDGLLFLQTAWSWLTVEQGARLTLYGGGRNNWTWKKDGLGELIITEKPWQARTDAGMFALSGGRIVFAARDNRFSYSSDMQTIGFVIGNDEHSDMYFEVTANYAFEDGTTSLKSTGSKYVQICDFHLTTNVFQRISLLSGNSNSILRGDYPAMIEIIGGYPRGYQEQKEKYRQAMEADPTQKKIGKTDEYNLENQMQVTGGLGFRKTGSDETLLFRGRDFESCGDLEVSAGVFEFAADASWRNGRVFKASNTGKFVFHGHRQINPAAVLYFEDGGVIKFEDVGEGEVIKISEVYVKDESTGGDWKRLDGGVFRPGDGSPLGKHLEGSGDVSVLVGGAGSIIRFY